MNTETIYEIVDIHRADAFYWAKDSMVGMRGTFSGCFEPSKVQSNDIDWRSGFFEFDSGRVYFYAVKVKEVTTPPVVEPEPERKIKKWMLVVEYE